MLRSRDTSKNAHQRNGIQIDEPVTGSSFTIWGILVCVLFTVIVAYFIFMDNNKTTNPSNISTIQASSSSISNSNIPPIQPLSQKDKISLQSDITSKILRKTQAASAKTLSALRPKILGDLNPLDNSKLERLMNRQKMLPHTNKLNLFKRPGLGSLKSLTGPRPGFINSGDSNSDIKEISFVLQAKSLPQSRSKQPSIFIRQTYPLKSDFNHEFVLIFLHGAAFSSATWSELGILQSLAQQGYISYALDVPGYGQSVKTHAMNNKWLREIIDKLIKNDVESIKHIESAGGIGTSNKKYILITASMSGKYAIPLLLDRPKDMIGMITIAPVATDKYKKEQYVKVSIPVCIIYGQEDKNLGVISKENLSQIPNHKSIMVPGGQHAAYQNDPKFFHQQVVKWLNEFF
eukprot:484609_1